MWYHSHVLSQRKHPNCYTYTANIPTFLCPEQQSTGLISKLECLSVCSSGAKAPAVIAYFHKLPTASSRSIQCKATLHCYVLSSSCGYSQWCPVLKMRQLTASQKFSSSPVFFKMSIENKSWLNKGNRFTCHWRASVCMFCSLSTEQ